MIDMFVILACCCRRAKNYNATITIITALLSKPIQRLSKTWTKVKELQNLAMLKTLANPSNNFRSLRKELKSQKEVLAPYLTLVGKDVFWIAQGANERQNIHEVESRTKLLARSIPRPARRIPEPCETCRNGAKCKVMEALTTFSIMSDDGKQKFQIFLFTIFCNLLIFLNTHFFEFILQPSLNFSRYKTEEIRLFRARFYNFPFRAGDSQHESASKIELIRGTPARL